MCLEVLDTTLKRPTREEEAQWDLAKVTAAAPA